MNAKVMNSIINIRSMLLLTLIAFGVITIPVPEDKKEAWIKVNRIMKVIAPMGMVAFIALEILR